MNQPMNDHTENPIALVSAAKPQPGQAVCVESGRYKGCILTYIGKDNLTGKHICQRSEHLGGLRVDSVTLYRE